MESPGSLYLNGTALWVLCDVWVQQVVMAASFSCVCFSGLLRGPALEMVHPATSSSRFALLFWQFTSKTPCLLEPLTLPGGSLVGFTMAPGHQLSFWVGPHLVPEKLFFILCKPTFFAPLFSLQCASISCLLSFLD